MNLHEYQAKSLFASYGLPVSEGYAVDTADEAVAAARARRREEARRRRLSLQHHPDLLHLGGSLEMVHLCQQSMTRGSCGRFGFALESLLPAHNAFFPACFFCSDHLCEMRAARTTS